MTYGRNNCASDLGIRKLVNCAYQKAQTPIIPQARIFGAWLPSFNGQAVNPVSRMWSGFAGRE